jgi:predicted dinucleotide-binding enzyme
MNIAIIGAGNMGATLGQKWTAAGHAVVLGVRDRNSAKARASAQAGAGRLEDLARALELGEVVLLSLPHRAVREFLAEHGHALDGKIVIDATNDFGADVISSVEAIRRAAPNAHVFRAFNSLGWENFRDPAIGGVQVDMFYCGPEGQARQAVERLIADVGLRPIRAGDLEQAHLVDNLGALWVRLAFGEKMGRKLAFKLLK